MGRIVEVRLQFTDACATKPVFCRRQRELDVLPLVQDAMRVEDLRDHADGTALDIEGLCQAARNRHGGFSRPGRAPARLPSRAGASRAAFERRCESNRLVQRRREANERSPGFAAAGTTVLGRFVLSDYSPSSHGSRYWLDRILPTAEAALYSSRRYAIYNVWRVLSEPPQDTPLALCDLRSLNAGDRVFRDCVHDPIDAPEQRFELSLYRFNPAQRWVYFSNRPARKR
jgi:hypothetical protein